MSATNHRFVVGVSSVSGGGKTSLVKATAGLLGAATLFFDDYAHLSDYPADPSDWVARGADVNEWRAPAFARDLAALRDGQDVASVVDGSPIDPRDFIVVEHPLGRAHREVGGMVDFMVLIDTPLEIAFARRLARNTANMPSPEELEARFAADLSEEDLQRAATDLMRVAAFLRDEAQQYLASRREVYVAVHEQVRADCDLIVDGCRPLDDLAQEVAQAVRQRREELLAAADAAD